MKMVVAYLPSSHLDRIVDALVAERVHGLSVSEVKGFGQEHDTGHPDFKAYSGIDWTTKIRLEVVCQDEEADGVLATIYQAGHHGMKGDGKVFVLHVEQALRLKTGERGREAIGPEFPAR